MTRSPSLRIVAAFAALLTLAAGATTAKAISVTVADYRNDFHVGAAVGQSGTFADGWSYQWNAPSSWNGTSTTAGNGNTGAISSVADFELLRWSGTSWRPDGDDNNANGLPAAFLTLNSTGGHPGRGTTQADGTVANNQNRYAIAAYTVAEGGRYYITDAFYQNTNLGAGNGQDVRISVNGNAPVFTLLLPDNATRPINTFVGDLSAGDTIYVAFGPNGSDGSDGFAHDFTVTKSIGDFKVVADYRDDYQTGGPAAGWEYLWNAPSQWDGATTPAGNGNTGPIGDPTFYASLNPVGAQYRPDNDTNSANGLPAAFLQLTSVGGHPGRGSTQADGTVANTLDRYAIAAFTVTEDGEYAITDSFVNSIDTAGTGGHIFIHVNNNAPLYFRDFAATAANISFDLLLGQLNAGDTIYVGIGPNGSDGSDSFNWDFSIAQLPIPEPATVSLLLMSVLGLGRRQRRAA
ncbi:MAG: PEP-CTERM sorting domain-containing protein [Phycisphaeraceae bacterium]